MNTGGARSAALGGREGHFARNDALEKQFDVAWYKVLVYEQRAHLWADARGDSRGDICPR